MQLFSLSKFLNFVNSIYSLLIINFKLKFSKKKTIFFYFPRKDLTWKDIDFIQDLMKELNKRYLVLYGHKLNSIKFKNFYFINESFLKYFKNLNLFISNYICDIFPKETKKIYIHHSLYDTPLTGRKNEIQTINRLKKYDFIFLSSKKMVKSFVNVFKIKNKNIKIIPTGYPRFDFFNKFKLIKKKNIIIAPANFLAYPDHTMIYDIEKIIELIKRLSDLKIIFRPHPANRIYFKKNCKNVYIDKIISKYSNDKNVLFDFSEDYSKSYSESLFMITDLSATAFTYSFLTLNPVLFYSPKENLFKKNYKSLNHYRDRKKIGEVANNISSLDKSLKKILKDHKKYSSSINLIRKKIDFIGKSKAKTIDSIDEILNELN